ncbi:MAG: D-amino-acid transaminase [Rhodospirillales bacterium]|jgi:D-alanine transaminase|nr:D-amino-acid transaminase [Rhodospirillales bacterium]MDP6884295.1 D-amino-acid transaminase [Rhodospirillales bacterium]
MTRIAYVNGRYVPHREAAVHIEDRGYQFSDGVYEVIYLHHGRFVDGEGHLARLARSLAELKIAWPMSRRALAMVMDEVVRRNRVRDGILYLQITRGVAPRNHAFPKASDSALVMTTRHLKFVDPTVASQGVSVITIKDIRWKRPDIKSVSLLPNVLGKQQAEEAGAYEAWMIDDKGRVTEGTLSNAWIVTGKGEVVTRNVDGAILNGITRLAVLELARSEGLRFVERPFSVKEAKSAREAFATGTSCFVKPVIRIDDKPVADGRAGPLTRKLMQYYADHIKQPAGMGAA